MLRSTTLPCESGGTAITAARGGHLHASSRSSRQCVSCPGLGATSAPTKFDVLVVGGGVTGGGAALDAATRGLSRRAGRGAGLRLRHVVALVEAVPRWPALPGAARLRAGPRGAARARADADPDRARTWSSRCSFLYPLTHRDLGAAVRRRGHDAVRPDGRGATDPCPRHQHLTRGGALRLVPGAASADALIGAHPLLRRAGRRRPAHPDRRPHRRGVRRDGAQLG